MDANHPDHQSPEALALQKTIRVAAARLLALLHPDLEGTKIKADGCFVTINRREEMTW